MNIRNEEDKKKRQEEEGYCRQRKKVRWKDNELMKIVEMGNKNIVIRKIKAVKSEERKRRIKGERKKSHNYQ